MYECSRQIYNVTLWDYGDLPSSPTQPARVNNSDPVLQKAFKSILPSVVRYTKDELKTLQEFKDAANAEWEKARIRKTPMGKIGLAAFLNEKGHPPSWAEAGGTDETAGKNKKRKITKGSSTTKADDTAAQPSPMKAAKAMKSMKSVNAAADEPQKAMKSMAMKSMKASDDGPKKVSKKPSKKLSKKAADSSSEVAEEPQHDDEELDGEELEVEDLEEDEEAGNEDEDTNKDYDMAARCIGLESAEGLSDIAKSRVAQIAARLSSFDSDVD